MHIRSTLIAAALTAAAFVPAAHAISFDPFLLGVNLNGPDAVIEGHAFSAEATAPGFSRSNDWYTYVYGGALTPAVSDEEQAALNDVIYLPFGATSGSIHQAVPNGVAYDVTLYYVEGAGAFARSFDLTGDLTATNLGSLDINHWTSTTLTTPLITDGSIDITMLVTANQPVLSAFSVSQAVPEPTAASLVLLPLAAATRRRRRA
jgi:hypothetical protein